MIHVCLPVYAHGTINTRPFDIGSDYSHTRSFMFVCDTSRVRARAYQLDTFQHRIEYATRRRTPSLSGRVNTARSNITPRIQNEAQAAARPAGLHRSTVHVCGAPVYATRSQSRADEKAKSCDSTSFPDLDLFNPQQSTIDLSKAACFYINQCSQI